MEQGKSLLAFDIETSFSQLRAHVKKGFQRFVSKEHSQVTRTTRVHIFLINGTQGDLEKLKEFVPLGLSFTVVTISLKLST